jgi:hypothetical protein
MRAQAIALTALALALLNVAVASLIARLAGADVLGGPLVALVVLAAGVLAAAGAVVAWRRYLTGAR